MSEPAEVRRLVERVAQLERERAAGRSTTGGLGSAAHQASPDELAILSSDGPDGGLMASRVQLATARSQPPGGRS
ncbi:MULTISPECIES: hypothetical protein [unclassified Kribbella]|uniref:hypothetical protein n=1 Tax=unclassified Kribbella TaxID=2644121 RepID=UPI00301859EB